MTQAARTGIEQKTSPIGAQSAAAKEDLIGTVKQASRKRFIPDVNAKGARTFSEEVH